MIIIDRIDDGVAVLETDTGMQTVPAEQMPQNARDGDVLRQNGLQYEVDTVATAERRQKIWNRIRRRKDTT